MHSVNDIIAAFYRHSLFSKEDLIKSFKMTMEFIEFDEDMKYTKMSRHNKLQLCKKFLAKLEKCRLPELAPSDWQFYDYEIFGDAIELNLCSTDTDMELSEDGKDISMMNSTVESTLLRVESNYVSIEQFAEIQEVTPLTVRNWIRKGKLRYARLSGNGEWLIPSTEVKPSRAYDFVQWTLLEPLKIDEFPLVAASEVISIHKDYENKSMYKCSFCHFQNKFLQDMELTRNNVEELEYALIASGKAKPSAPIRWVPLIDRLEE
jgi:excisionase family DNA binding protein